MVMNDYTCRKDPSKAMNEELVTSMTKLEIHLTDR
jgi:hypothetical protein